MNRPIIFVNIILKLDKQPRCGNDVIDKNNNEGDDSNEQKKRGIEGRTVEPLKVPSNVKNSSQPRNKISNSYASWCNSFVDEHKYHALNDSLWVEFLRLLFV